MGALKSLISLAIDASTNNQSSRRTSSPEPTINSKQITRSISSLVRSDDSHHQRSPELQLQSAQLSGITTKTLNSTSGDGERENYENIPKNERREEKLSKVPEMQQNKQPEHRPRSKDDETHTLYNESRIYPEKPPPFTFDLHAPLPPQPLTLYLSQLRDVSIPIKTTGGREDSSLPTTEHLQDQDDECPISSDEREETIDDKPHGKHALMEEISLALEVIRARKHGMRKTKRDRLVLGVDVVRGWTRRDEKRREGNRGDIYCVPTL